MFGFVAMQSRSDSCLSFSDLIFDSRVDPGIPSLAAAPAGPDTRPPSFPQRRNLHRKNVQAIKQITSKRTLSDGSLQVTVSGSDHPRIGLDGASSTDTFEFVFLQNTQVSDLSLGRKASDFIEEDRASLGQLKAAQTLLGYACKGALLMAQQF
jgi:hypothetical protein